MLPRIPENRIIERLVRGRDGRLALVTVHVFEESGRVRARVLDVAYLEERVPATGFSTLPGCCAESASVLPCESVRPITFESPYADSLRIHLFGSKPRAPSF